MTDHELYKTALSKAMALCSGREYCSEDIRNKLHSWGVGGNDTEKILTELARENFINEDRFASAFVRDKYNYNKWGRVKISASLRAKSIPSGIIQSALSSIDDETYINNLKLLISAHRKTIKAKNQYDLKGKLYRFGISKGYESSLLYDILSEF